MLFLDVLLHVALIRRQTRKTLHDLTARFLSDQPPTLLALAHSVPSALPSLLFLEQASAIHVL